MRFVRPLLISACLALSLMSQFITVATNAHTAQGVIEPAKIAGDFTFPSALADEFVRYPSSEVAFICGPQLRFGSSQNPAPWFDKVQREWGLTHGERSPRIAPFGPMTFDKADNSWRNVIAGRVSISQGSTVVTGRGTRFTLDVGVEKFAPYAGHLRVRDASGTERALKVRSIDSDTRLTLVNPWANPSVTNAVADTFWDDHDVYGANVDYYYLANYYDSALVQYINYYRSGDARFLNYARKTADAFWHSQYIGDGTIKLGHNNHLPPRAQALAGLMLRALDGRPEMWDYLEREVRASFDNWVYQRRNDPALYYDIREDGYEQLYAVMTARVLPDSYAVYANGTMQPSTGRATDGAAKRASYLRQTEDAAVNFFGRLQKADGSWRWNEDDRLDLEQPFMVGLYLESAILLDQLTTNPTVKASLREQITRACRHLFRDAFRKEAVPDLPQYRWRGMWYFWGGRKPKDPAKYQSEAGERLAHGDVGIIRAVRHLNSTVHHAFGYAFGITGDRDFLRMGDEIFDASYGDRVDGLHCLADSGKGKDYDMNYRASGRYLAWRLATPLTTRPRVTAARPN